MTGISHFTK